jgi:hypothetical protein
MPQNNANHQRPPRYKLALLTWAGAYVVIITMELRGFEPLTSWVRSRRSPN